MKNGVYVANVEEKGEDYAILKIEYPDGREASLFRFSLGQTIGVALDEDGTFDVFFTLADILTRRAVFHIEKTTESSRVTASVTKETAKEERPVLTFSLAGKRNLTSVITAIILISLMIIYIFLSVIRAREGKKR